MSLLLVKALSIVLKITGALSVIGLILLMGDQYFTTEHKWSLPLDIVVLLGSAYGMKKLKHHEGNR